MEEKDFNELEVRSKTFIEARTKLKERNRSLSVLADKSEKIVNMFKRQDTEIGDEICEKMKETDLIGLFDETADEMQDNINRIGSSLDYVLSLIE